MTPAERAAQLGLDKAAYTRKETAKKMSLGLTKVDEMVADGTLKSVKLGSGSTAKRLILGVSIAEVLTPEVSDPQ
jgi:hypothetical protein